MILVDVNILIYSIGAPHPHKEPSLAFIRRFAQGEVAAVVDAEILQEILYRYRGAARWEEGRRLYDYVRSLFPVVIPITAEILDLSRELLDEYPNMQARDALHAAVVLSHRLDGICSYDRDLDGIRGLKRFLPEEV